MLRLWKGANIWQSHVFINAPDKVRFSQKFFFMDIGEYEVLIWGLNEKVLVVRLVGGVEGRDGPGGRGGTMRRCHMF
jgi:hypothetical protein